MKILQIIHDFVPETLAGAEIIAHNLSVSLVNKGHEVFVFCRGWKLEGEPYAIRDESFDGLKVRRIDFGRDGQPHRSRRHDPRIDQELRDYLAVVQPDIIHIHNFNFLTTDLVAIAKESGAPVVHTLHDFLFRCPVGSRLFHDDTLCDRHPDLECISCLWPYNPSRKRNVIPWRTLNPLMISLYRAGLGGLLPEDSLPRKVLDSLATWKAEFTETLSLTDAIHSPSQFLGDMVIDFGMPCEKVFVIENGIQYQPDQALPKKPSKRLRFGQIGNNKLKGTEVAVKAMKYLPHEAAELQVYGGMSEADKEELQRIAGGAHIRLMGSYKQNQLPEVFSEIDVLIVPSIWYENCPTVIREAFANNTPVVTTGIGGMAEAVCDGVDGFHFKVADPVDLAQKLQRFIDKPGLVDDFRANIKLPPTAEYFSSEIEQIYNKLLITKGSEHVH